jgi:hypothetical protein
MLSDEKHFWEWRFRTAEPALSEVGMGPSTHQVCFNAPYSVLCMEPLNP